MNILYINHYAGSPKHGMAFRPYYLAREWQKDGHVVTIIGADNSHLRRIQPKAHKDLWEENLDGIKYLWVRTPKYSSAGIRRIFNILVFVVKLLVYSFSISKRLKPDVVIASSTYPLDIYPAYLIAKKSNGKLVFELHDMWPLSPMIIGGYSKYHPFIWIMQRAENFSCKKSNGYVSMIGNAEEYLINHGLKPGKFVHIPNGFLREEWLKNSYSTPVEHRSFLEKLRANGRVIIGYTGGHAPSNALDVVVDVALELSDTNIEFVLVGTGPSKGALKQYAESLNVRNLHFLNPIDKKEIPNLLSSFDILYTGGVSGKLHYYGTAFNKLTDYMLAEKPIIFSVDEPNSLVERIGCGIQIPAEDKNSLINAIRYLVQLPENELQNMGAKGKNFAVNELDYKILSKKFIAAIESF